MSRFERGRGYLKVGDPFPSSVQLRIYYRKKKRNLIISLNDLASALNKDIEECEKVYDELRTKHQWKISTVQYWKRKRALSISLEHLRSFLTALNLGWTATELSNAMSQFDIANCYTYFDMGNNSDKKRVRDDDDDDDDYEDDDDDEDDDDMPVYPPEFQAILNDCVESVEAWARCTMADVAEPILKKRREQREAELTKIRWPFIQKEEERRIRTELENDIMAEQKKAARPSVASMNITKKIETNPMMFSRISLSGPPK